MTRPCAWPHAICLCAPLLSAALLRRPVVATPQIELLIILPCCQVCTVAARRTALVGGWQMNGQDGDSNLGRSIQ